MDRIRRFAVVAVGLAPSVVVAGCGGAGAPPTPSAKVASPSTPANAVGASPRTPASAVVVPCSAGGDATTVVSARRDAVLGSLVLVGARQTITEQPTGPTLGYKIPVTLPTGITATLSVAPPSRGHVGLVFTEAAKSRVSQTGLGGADLAVSFRACGRIGATARTGWPGVLVVDRPRCLILDVTIGGASLRHRVPLGRPCEA